MPTVQLSEHFTLAEFTYSQTASREGISNQPDAAAMKCLKRTADTMEQVRLLLGSNPIQITSGYRGPELNAAIGGSSTSAHMSGLAADFICPAFGDPLEICNAIKPYLNQLKVDQLIWEYADWVHLSLADEGEIPREETLTIDNSGTRHGIPNV